jgi:hypothetical protein
MMQRSEVVLLDLSGTLNILANISYCARPHPPVHTFAPCASCSAWHGIPRGMVPRTARQGCVLCRLGALSELRGEALRTLEYLNDTRDDAFDVVFLRKARVGRAACNHAATAHHPTKGPWQPCGLTQVTTTLPHCRPPPRPWPRPAPPMAGGALVTRSRSHAVLIQPQATLPALGRQ